MKTKKLGRPLSGKAKKTQHCVCMLEEDWDALMRLAYKHNCSAGDIIVKYCIRN
jgi:hypothetical protein